jgi:hypothetical protein
MSTAVAVQTNPASKKRKNTAQVPMSVEERHAAESKLNEKTAEIGKAWENLVGNNNVPEVNDIVEMMHECSLSKPPPAVKKTKPKTERAPKTPKPLEKPKSEEVAAPVDLPANAIKLKDRTTSFSSASIIKDIYNNLGSLKAYTRVIMICDSDGTITIELRLTATKSKGKKYVKTWNSFLKNEYGFTDEDMLLEYIQNAMENYFEDLYVDLEVSMQWETLDIEAWKDKDPDNDPNIKEMCKKIIVSVVGGENIWKKWKDVESFGSCSK